MYSSGAVSAAANGPPARLSAYSSTRPSTTVSAPDPKASWLTAIAVSIGPLPLTRSTVTTWSAICAGGGRVTEYTSMALRPPSVNRKSPVAPA